MKRSLRRSSASRRSRFRRPRSQAHRRADRRERRGAQGVRRPHRAHRHLGDGAGQGAAPRHRHGDEAAHAREQLLRRRDQVLERDADHGVIMTLGELADAGLPISCETDLGGAITLAILRAVTLGAASGFGSDDPPSGERQRGAALALRSVPTWALKDPASGARTAGAHGSSRRARSRFPASTISTAEILSLRRRRQGGGRPRDDRHVRLV